MTSVRIAEIKIEGRVRKDMGDLAELARSMQRHGLLHPVVVKKDKTLVAGHRRIEAASSIGWKDIPVTVIEVEDLLSAERDENEVRKDFTPTEAVEIGRLIEEQHAKVIEAQETARKALGPKTSAKQLGQERAHPKREIAARAVGLAETTYHKAKQIVAAAEADPEKFGDLPAKMDETGNVYGTHRELERRRTGDFKGDAKRNGFRKNKSAPFEIKTKRHGEVAEGQKSRMVRSLSTVTGHCRGLEELDVPMILAVCSKEELKEWEGKAREAGRAFFLFARKLQEGIKT